jgi:hypothetical protein
MPDEGLSPDRVLDILLGAEAIFGSGREAAAEIGLARSTYNDLVNEVTHTVSQRVIDTVTEYLQGNGPGVTSGLPAIQGALQGAADIFAGLPPGEIQSKRIEFRNDPALFQKELKAANDAWHDEQRYRQKEGLPPLVGHSA